MFPISSFKPYTVTMAFAWRVTFSRSPRLVEILSKTTFSAVRPPNVAHISSSICSVRTIMCSSGRYHAAPKDCPLGTMELLLVVPQTLRTNSPWRVQLHEKAMVFFSSCVMILFFFRVHPQFGQLHLRSLVFQQISCFYAQQLVQLRYKHLRYLLLRIQGLFCKKIYI